MKIRTGIFTIVSAAIALITLTACGGGAAGPSYDPESPEGEAQMYRNSVMELARQKSGMLIAMANEEIEVDEAAFVQAAADLAALAAMMPAGFENQTLVDESRTDPAVFDNWDDFESKFEALIDATADLAATAENGGFAAAQGMVRTATGNCGNCHRPYRLAEAE